MLFSTDKYLLFHVILVWFKMQLSPIGGACTLGGTSSVAKFVTYRKTLLVAAATIHFDDLLLRLLFEGGF